MEKGNLTEYLNKFQELYSELLKKGKDLYTLGNDPLWILGLDRIKREPVEGDKGIFGYLKLRPEDAKEIKKMFPRNTNTEEQIIKESCIKPYEKNSKYEFISLEGLESILKGNVFKAYEIDIDIH